MTRELKDVMYVLQLRKNLTSVGALKVQGLKGTLREGVLKMSSSRRNNLYYLKCIAITKNLAASEHLKDDSTVEGAFTCNLELGGHDVMDKMTKVKFDITTYRLEGLPDCVHVSIWDSTKIASPGGHRYFVSFIDNISRRCWVYPMRQIFEVLHMLVKWKNMMEKQIGKKIKILQIDSVRKYKDQFL